MVKTDSNSTRDVKTDSNSTRDSTKETSPANKGKLQLDATVTDQYITTLVPIV